MDPPALLHVEGLALLEVEAVAGDVPDVTLGDVTNGNGKNFTRAGNFHALFDAGEVTEDDDTDLALVEVQREPESAIGKAK